MKLLLTSNGITNTSIAKALADVAGGSLPGKKLAFIPTAANVETGGKSWLINQLVSCQKLGLVVDIVDISAIPQEIWQPRLEQADVLLFGGGNTSHLLYWIKKSGLEKVLPSLLETRIYVGISAGSIVATKSLLLSSETKKELAKQLGEYMGEEALGFVDFHIRPHLNSPHFPQVTIENIQKVAEKTKEPMYVIDDDTAVKADGNDITVVSEGTWKKFN